MAASLVMVPVPTRRRPSIGNLTVCARNNVCSLLSCRQSLPDLAFEGGTKCASNMSRRVALFSGLTTLAGAGGVFTPTSEAAEYKQKNLPIEDVKKIIEADVINGQYLVTGNITQSIYDDNCRFQDPLTDVTGVQKYSLALQLLFDPALSKLELLNSEIRGPRTVEVSWRLSGYMKFPWHPYIPPYEGTTRYTTGEDGLISSLFETWSISGPTAVAQFLVPSWLRKDAPS